MQINTGILEVDKIMQINTGTLEVGMRILCRHTETCQVLM